MPDNKTTWLNALPNVSDGMSWLLGISHAGYLAYKAAPHVNPLVQINRPPCSASSRRLTQP
jgi:hypothetical protein